MDGSSEAEIEVEEEEDEEGVETLEEMRARLGLPPDPLNDPSDLSGYPPISMGDKWNAVITMTSTSSPACS